MHNVVKRTFILILVVVAYLGGMIFLGYEIVNNSSEWVMHQSSPYWATEPVNYINSVYDANGVCLLKLETITDEDGNETQKLIRNEDDELLRRATLHALGGPYLEIGITGKFTGVPLDPEYEYDILNGLHVQAQDNESKDFYLTLNGDVCKTAYEQLNGRNGVVGVYNYKTGEIVCMVSTPAFDPANPPVDNAALEKDYPESTYNKMLMLTYTPGSIFKIVTAACAIENNLPNLYTRTFDCDGALEVPGFDSKVICNSVHGRVNFERALNCSCNWVFGKLAIELGPEKLQATAERLGFGEAFEVDRHAIAKSTIELEGVSDITLGWAGIGQHTTRVNPCMMMTLMGAIANDGQAVKPYYVKEAHSAYDDSVLYQAQTETTDAIQMNTDTAIKLKRLLRSNVQNYYTDDRFPGLEMCGKTGTAEVGDTNNAWFVGFSQREDFPYAVVVMIEKSSESGSMAAIPVANNVLQSMIGG